MIRHIVMFKLKDGVNGKTAMENAMEAQREAEKLKELIPSIEKMEVVCNSQKADKSNCELALICDFKDIDGLNTYQQHPEHLKFGSLIGQWKESRACIDYEY
ncbi:MAG: Dabb family protein [Lachnospiraceae bacterium]|nr:Dabb family protein [Lachnospiraceae bacterium]